MYKLVFMRTNIELDDKLMKEAIKLSKIKTKKELVNIALEEYVKKLKRIELANLFGKIEWEGDLDEMRTSRR